VGKARTGLCILEGAEVSPDPAHLVADDQRHALPNGQTLINGKVVPIADVLVPCPVSLPVC
jgi:hypothetical protein